MTGKMPLKITFIGFATVTLLLFLSREAKSGMGGVGYDSATHQINQKDPEPAEPTANQNKAAQKDKQSSRSLASDEQERASKPAEEATAKSEPDPVEKLKAHPEVKDPKPPKYAAPRAKESISIEPVVVEDTDIVRESQEWLQDTGKKAKKALDSFVDSWTRPKIEIRTPASETQKAELDELLFDIRKVASQVEATPEYKRTPLLRIDYPERSFSEFAKPSELLPKLSPKKPLKRTVENRDNLNFLLEKSKPLEIEVLDSVDEWDRIATPIPKDIQSIEMASFPELKPAPKFPKDQMRLLALLLDYIHHEKPWTPAYFRMLQEETKVSMVKRKASFFTHESLLNQKVRSIATEAMISILEKDLPIHIRKAAYRLLSDHDAEYLSNSQLNRIAKLLKNEEKGIEKATRHKVEYLLAQNYFKRGDHNRGLKFIRNTPRKSGLAGEKAAYLRALYKVKEGKDGEAIRELTEIFRYTQNDKIFDLSALALGRLYFRLGEFDAARVYLDQVNRQSNHFIDAAVDLAWADLRKKSFNRVAGNLFTLHSPFYRETYIPESFFVRSLAYQNLCQFADASKSLQRFRKDYIPVLNAMEGNKGVDVYNQVARLLSAKRTALPSRLLRDIARQPQFLSFQNQINKVSNELNSMKKIEAARQRADRKLAKEIREHKVELTKPRSKDIQKVREGLIRKIRQAHRERKNIAKATPGLNSIKKDIRQLRRKRSKHHLAKMKSFLNQELNRKMKELKYLVANNSLLEYEIYEAASSNLQLQAAQKFKVDTVEKEKIKEQGKAHWPFENEFWEDEMNHFQSKIINNCANRETATK
jgi:hypothetical protein